MGTQKKRRAKKGAWPVRTMRDGEPIVLPFTKFRDDPMIATSAVEGCCDCGLRHLMTYELVKSRKGDLLVIRAYRLPR